MLTAAEAAAQLGVKLGTLYAYVSRGWLKSYRRRVGREALYRRTDIEALRGMTMPERGRRARSLPDLGGNRCRVGGELDSRRAARLSWLSH
jgi:excisionase family DNA binding protein